MRNKTTLSSLFLLAFIISSCSSLASTPTATPTASPTSTATITPLPTATITPTATPLPVMERAKYTLNTTIDYDAHTVIVNETILYPNHTGNQLNTLVLAVEPNRLIWQGGFTLSGISLDGAPTTTYTLKDQRLDIALSSLFLPEHVITINIQYSLSLPFVEPNDPKVSRPQIYGYTKRQLNLTNWYPFVVPHINGDWVLHEPWYYGEHLVYDAADYEVNLKFADPASAPIVAASGFPEQQADSTRYTITSARAFAISASREYQVASLQVGDVIVSSYYFPSGKGAGQAVLQTSAEAIQVFSERYGPYPHKTLSIVMADFKDSMEFSALYFHSPLYYEQYDGTHMNYLTYIGVHETAHQWWFEQVANDQAQQPWLDEALATYSERVYYETLYPDRVPTWWAYRVDFFQPQGFIDTPIYDAKGFEPYRVTVYLNGVHFLEALRKKIGDEAFFAFLQDYLVQERGKIATTNDFFHILNKHTSADYSSIVLQYFQNVYQ